MRRAGQGAGVIAQPSASVQDIGDAKDVSAVAAYLAGLYERHLATDEGAVATYIPELSGVDPSLFGICLATVDGSVYEAGDARVPFTIQSMSKPLTYGLALERLGREAVRRRIGVEPSGDAFNEISISPATGTPCNPLINAGAITCAGLVANVVDDPFQLLLDTYSRYAGRALELDEAVYRSETDTGHRNRGMAHLLRGAGVLDNPDAALDLYFRQCSISVECRDLAVMAATLANGGLNPITRERAVGEEVVRDVLSVMASCGMYDFAGEWLVSVGLPAKSGVSGGVFAVLPGRLGIARLLAPGRRAGELGARDRRLPRAVAGSRRPPRPPGRAPGLAGAGRRTRPADRGSKRVRLPAHRDAIHARFLARARGRAAGRAQLQRERGARALRRAAGRAARGRRGRSEPGRAHRRGRRALHRGARRAHRGPRRPARLDAGPQRGRRRARRAAGERRDLLQPRSRARVVRGGAARPHRRGACRHRGRARRPRAAGRPHEQPSSIASCPTSAPRPPRREGCWYGRESPQPRCSWSSRGRSASCGRAPTGTTHRLTTLSAGGTFGELAFVERRSRAADVRADSEVVCRTLPYATIDALAVSDPVLHGKLLRNLLSVVISTLHVVNAEVAHLTR